MTPESYAAITNDIAQSLKYKLGYPSSLMGMLSGCFRDNELWVDDTYAAERLINNELVGFIPNGFAEVFTNNVGDPWEGSKSTDAHETKSIEKEVVGILGKYFGQREADTRGYITAGGTEGNMAAIWWARLTLENNAPHRLMVVGGKSAHYSIAKICNIMNLPFRAVDCEDTGSLSIAHFNAFLEDLKSKPLISKLIVVITVGATITGSIDDAIAVRNLLRQFKSEHKDFDYVIHIDGALNGITMPILKPFGDIKNYFEELDVSTISISGHKFLGTPVCGVLITNNAFLEQAFPHKRDVEYCGDIKDITISGSRPGINSMLLHNTLHAINLDRDNKKIALIIHNNIRNAEYFYTHLVDLLGKDKVSWLPNQFNVLFQRPSEYMMKKYQLMPISNNRCVACILQNVTPSLMDCFIGEYRDYLRDSK